MTKDTIKNIVIIVLAVVSLGLYASQANILGGSGATHYQQESFLQGLYGGSSRQLSVSNAGLLTTSGGVTNTGALTQSGSATFTGAVSNTAATSTFGCLRIFQIGATTVASTTYYLVASSTIGADATFPIIATSTKPAYCN